MQGDQVIQSPIREWITKIIAKDRLAHAYLFVGKRGAGKKDMALFFAQSFFCQNKQNHVPCRTCQECTRIEHRNHPDVHWVEPENTSIKIDQVRLLQKEFSYRGVESSKKVYIMDRIETMTVQASNSLLKFLEEPYPGTVAILMSEQRQRLLPTILSRCQEISFQPPSPEQVINQLAPEFGDSLVRTASHITTDMEEVKQLCQSEWFAELRSLMIQLIEEIQLNPSKAFFHVQDKWLKLAKEREQIDIALDILLFWYKDLLYTKCQLTDKHINIDKQDQLNKQALLLSQKRITRGIEVILNAKKRLHANVNPQLLLEQLVLRLKEG